jgi:hypothetical protein
MATAPAVATIGTAKFFVFFVTKRHAAIPAVASDDVDKGFVNEFHRGILKNKAPTSGALKLTSVKKPSVKRG